LQNEEWGERWTGWISGNPLLRGKAEIWKVES